MFDNAVKFNPGFEFLVEGNLDESLDSKHILSIDLDSQRVFDFIFSKPIKTSKGLFRVIFGSDSIYDDKDRKIEEKLSFKIVPIILNNPKEFRKDFFDKWCEMPTEEKIHDIFMNYLYVES